VKGLGRLMQGAVLDRCCTLGSTMGAEVMQKSEFDQLLVRSVDGALEDVLGARFREAFYRYLEQSFQTTRTTLPSRIDTFLSALSTCLGKTASLVMGRAIAKRLYAELGLRFIQKPGYSLLNYVADAEHLLRDH
jgi:hypothetical protein